MRFAVSWTPSSQQQLAAVWLASANRAGVTGATLAIDMLLAIDPDQRGVPNFDTVRTLVHTPLGVDFGDYSLKLHRWEPIPVPSPPALRGRGQG